MPTSEHWQIPRVVDVLVRERPQSVLDVGAGYGKYGLLAREYGGGTRGGAGGAGAPPLPGYAHLWVGDPPARASLLSPRPQRAGPALFLHTRPTPAVGRCRT